MSESPVRLYVRLIREARGLTQQAFADKVGCSRSYITNIEGGHELPSLPMLAKFAQALGVSMRDLLDERPCPGCPYWERDAATVVLRLSATSANEGISREPGALATALMRRTTWLTVLGTSGVLTMWLGC